MSLLSFDVTVNLETGVGEGNGNDTLISMENVTGSIQDDKITGSSVDNVLKGGKGNDVLTGGDGHDTLFAGADNDVLIGGSPWNATPEHQLVDHFSGVANEVMVVVGAGSTTVLSDFNGDNVADFAVQLSDPLHLIASDFLLRNLP